MEKLSVVIITYNEAPNIGRCLDSVKGIADEIVVLDSFSSDETARIADEKGARVFCEPFRGHVEQKNRVTLLATYNYVLSIDADEALSRELRSAILEAKKTFTYSAYRIKRCTNHCGRFIRHGSWYPDRKVRLFDKRLSHWGGINPHDKIVFKRPVAVKQLQGEILHYSFATVREHIAKNERYSSIAAESYFEAGKRTNAGRVIINPLWAFLYDFFIRHGFLNGRQGWTIAWNQAMYTYLKHKKLLWLQRKRKNKHVSNIQTATDTDRLPRNIRTHITCEE